jgi:hypothetical protein
MMMNFLAPAMTPPAEPTPMPPEVHEGIPEEQVHVTKALLPR